MTSRERIRKFLAGQAVDRIPNGLGGCETAGLHLLAYDKLKKVLDVNDSKNRMCTFMTNSIMEPSVLDAMEGDIILLSSRMSPSRFWGDGHEKEWKDVIFWGKKFQVPNAWNFRTELDGTIWWNDSLKCPPDGIFFDWVPPPPSQRISLKEEPKPIPDDYSPSHAISDEWLRNLEESAKWLYENTDYSITCGEMINDLQLKPGGLRSWWMRIADEPDIAHEFLHKACEAGISQLKLVDQAVGKYADMLMIADDIGDVRGVTIGPDSWREIYKIHYKQLFTEWHKITKMKVSLHCCGSVYDILGDLIECGVDVFNPVQISAKNMDPKSLKMKFGDRIIFYGGCFDVVQNPSNTPADMVYENVKRNITILNENGRYIFAGVHNIPGDTPESHIKAMLDAYYDCRFSAS